MAVSDQETVFTYTGNGITTVFPFQCLVLDKDDLVVYLDGIEQEDGYTISGIGVDDGGSVEFDTPPATGVEVLIARILPLQRTETDYQQNGDFPAETVNKDFDRLWMAAQQLQEEVNRSVKLPLGSTLLPELPPPSPGRVMKWNEDGTALINSEYDPDQQVAAAEAAAETAIAQAETATAAAGVATTAAQAAEAAQAAAEAAAEAAHVAIDVASHGQCILAKSGANLLLSPYNGNKLIISGKQCKIPTAGVSLGPASLTASTVYNIYAVDSNDDGIVDALEASTTARATDNNTGVEIKSGDATRTLVGKWYCNSEGAWSSVATEGLSYFNRKPKSNSGSFSANRTTNSGGFTEVHSEIRAHFLSWGEGCDAYFSGSGRNSSSTAINYVGIAVDSTVILTTPVITWSADIQLPLNISGYLPAAEGLRYITLMAKISTGSLTITGDTDADASKVQVTVWG